MRACGAADIAKAETEICGPPRVMVVGGNANALRQLPGVRRVPVRRARSGAILVVIQAQLRERALLDFAHLRPELRPEGRMHFYRVCVAYREPTLERWRGWGPRRFLGIFVVRAECVADAEMRATNAFNDIAMTSGVCWVREIVDVRVEPVADATTEQLDGAAA